MTQWLRYSAGIAGIFITCTTQALDFSIQRIPLNPDQTIAFMPFPAGEQTSAELLVIETPDLDERQRQQRGLLAEPTRTVNIYSRSESGWNLRLRQELAASMDLIDTLRSVSGVAVAGYQDGQVLVLDEATQKFLPLLSTTSMYVGINADTSPDIRLFEDLNDDGIDDLLLPDFVGWRVAFQGTEGFSAPELRGPSAHMTFGDTARFVGYRAQTPYLFDQNLDGLEDLAFWRSGRFEVYIQQSEGGFAADPILNDPDQKDVVSDFLSVTLNDDEDDDAEEKGPQRIIDAVDDIDGDGYADLIIQTLIGDGIFGLETRYEIYRGLKGADQWLQFEPQASSTIASGGIQLNNERLDLTGDGKQEFVVTSVHISLASIISALITRSVSVAVSIYQMQEGVFPEQPSLEKEIKVRFDLGNGDVFVPAVLSADVNGDGRKDLLVQKGLDTLLIYPGEPSAALFARTPIKLELSLPEDREGFLVADLDDDGRDELILHVEENRTSTLQVVQFSQ